MTQVVFGKIIGDGDAMVDIERLMETRALIQANSGGGKSRTIRKIVEEMAGLVQIMILDVEGEFSTLREKYEFVLIGPNGDKPASTKTAEVLARRLLELRASTIIDLSEMEMQERKHFVKLFLNALIDAPKELRHYCAVIIDEAHIFAPENGESESLDAVNSLMTRGRKRGLCGILATQRLSKLAKDSAAEANNKLIGRTGLDVDRKRASQELGFSTKEQDLSLRDLEPGEFFMFGPALSKTVQKVMVGSVKTTHPKVGDRLQAVTTPTPEKVRSMLSKLDDIPQIAEKERMDKEALQAQILSLKRSLRDAQLNPNSMPAEKVKVVQDQAFAQGLRSGQESGARRIKDLETILHLMKSVIRDMTTRTEATLGIVRKADTDLSQISDATGSVAPNTTPTPLFVDRPVKLTSFAGIQPPVSRPNGGGVSGSETSLDDKPLREGAMKMLKAAAQFYPTPITRDQIAAWSALSATSGTFSTYLSELKKKDWLKEGQKDIFEITESGLKAAGDVQPLPTDPDTLIDMWARKFRDGAAKMLREITAVYPASITKEELGGRTGFTYTSGTFSTYLSELRRNGLVNIQGQDLTASETLFQGGRR